jgi:CBS domain-containing protein
MSLRVQDLMSWHPPAIASTGTIDEGLALMLRDESPDLYVVHAGGQLAGVVPDFAFLKARLTKTPGNMAITTIMSRSLAAVTPDMPLAEILPLFREGRYQRVAVEDRGRLVGVISRSEILRIMVVAEQLEIDLGDLGEPVDTRVPRGNVPAPRFMQYRRTLTEAAPNAGQ